MPRLVVPEHPGQGRLAARSISDFPKDDYKDRLVKYIPAESVAFYTFTDKLLIALSGLDPGGAAKQTPIEPAVLLVSLGLFIVGLIGTPIYLSKQRLPKQPWKLHAVLSTLAFCCWVYTLGGSLILILGWYHVLFAAFAAPVFTFVAGWFEPKPW